MPLPRFDRLPPDARAAILGVARTHFARDGKDAASFNRIIAEAGISKTSAYHYFDGKGDLFDAVVGDAAGRMLTVLGPWVDVPTERALWEQVATGAERLVAHLGEHPDDRAVLAGHQRRGQDGDTWIQHLVANGLRLGLVDPYPDAALITVATQGIFEAVDSWALDHPGEREHPVGEVLVALLARVWNTTRRPDGPSQLG